MSCTSASTSDPLSGPAMQVRSPSLLPAHAQDSSNLRLLVDWQSRMQLSQLVDLVV